MKKKKKVWVGYQRKGDTLEIILRDITRRKISSWEINISDKKRAKQIMKQLKKTYGIDFGFDFKKERDMEWLP